MKAIIQGTIANGFEVSKVVEDDVAGKIVADLLQSGQIAEALEVRAPESYGSFCSADKGGKVFVVFDHGFSGGFTVAGPLSEVDVADDFAEENRGEDEEYSVIICDDAPA